LGPNPSLSSHPIIIDTSEFYSVPVSEFWAQEFKVGPNLYVINPEKVSQADRNTWSFFAFSDYYSCEKAYVSSAQWSTRGQVLTLSTSGVADFKVVLNRTYDYRVNVRMLIPSGNGIRPVVRFLLDNLSIAPEYIIPSGLNIAWLNATLPPTANGIHAFAISVSGNTLPVQIDIVVIRPYQVPLSDIMSAFATK